MISLQTIYFTLIITKRPHLQVTSWLCLWCCWDEPWYDLNRSLSH